MAQDIRSEKAIVAPTGAAWHSEPPAVAAHKTKTDFAYETLRREILAGRYPPGSRIVADQVAQEMALSRVPVREAIGRLAGEGWLQIKPHVGAVVPELSPDEILETSAMRAALEGMAVRLAVESGLPPDVEQLRQLIDRLEVLDPQSASEYEVLNVHFHSTTLQTCPYPSLRAMAISLSQKITYRFSPVRALPQNQAESHAEHRALLAALERRDAIEAERVVRHHAERAGRVLWRFAMDRVESNAGHILRPMPFGESR